MTRADADSQTRPAESPKISDTHRAKLAVVNVRQSTPRQVVENRESLARQYALADHARFLGWPTERVLVIDDDLGLSGRCRTDFTEPKRASRSVLVNRCSTCFRRGTLRPRGSRPFAPGIDPAADVA